MRHAFVSVLCVVAAGVAMAGPMEDASEIATHIKKEAKLTDVECDGPLADMAEQFRQASAASGGGHSLTCSTYDGEIDAMMKSLDGIVRVRAVQEWEITPGENAGRGWMGSLKEWEGLPASVTTSEVLLSLTAAIEEKSRRVILQVALIPQ